ncbi:hypothetical protein J3L16_01625 [Alteromonas sp. 5E99-2]|uniref:hypothetical protein n=1 Tax=Alteromonas sp. 5E99-2 TaxID=2817683 RepID=UPI001A9836A1|nr:hypothetical protein [Alteromonas sp. 5E99-2]MBO1254379.1 hypothetical protein [Alteromonas sp. 5E99-2]
MTNSSFEQKLEKQLTEIKEEKQPEKDLWQGIELALTHDPRLQETNTNSLVGKKLHLLVATVAVFGLIGWLSLNYQPNRLSGEDLVRALSEQHVKQKEALLVTFQDQPALTENWQQQLSELDDAADAIKMALKNEPNNMALLRMLQSVHQQQINLIERVHSPKWSQI